jgi:hypothetical protein
MLSTFCSLQFFTLSVWSELNAHKNNVAQFYISQDFTQF